MIDSSLACSPSQNAVIHAAAGTGKTWLLTSRVVRLLLDGIRPGSILAITFTRKAAGEMHQRVLERLFALARADENELTQLLEQIGADTEASTRKQARSLYEAVLMAIPEFRATTFHAFCQDILRRFPLEAGIATGFELCEAEEELIRLAWRRFTRDLFHMHESTYTQAMEVLLDACGGLFNARNALMDFLAHRSDWWAYTENQTDPVAYASGRLEKTLDIPTRANPLESLLFDTGLIAGLERYKALLTVHPTATQRRFIDQLAQAVSAEFSAEERYLFLSQVFFTSNGKPRAFKPSQSLAKELGPDKTDELLQLHQYLMGCLINVQDKLNRHDILKNSRAWYLCGQRLLEYYQELKEEQTLLDFSDLEWITYRLLNRGRQAEWVQYKLDQRIDHLLVDEFQDTNPTQWRLLLPLLEEMAAGNPQRPRSVFLVGDEKQSIYRFRRADPKLFDTAHKWLTGHTRTQTFSQHISWRSSPAITEFVNLIFHTHPEAGRTPDTSTEDYGLPGFQAHDTRHREMWGNAELLPLVRSRAGGTPETTGQLRNPLLQPRRVEEDERHRQEGESIAAKIHELIGRPIADRNATRALGYGDIMILLRDRTHAESYEDALRQAGIPYTGIGRASYSECLEIRDLTNLLKALLASYDNLALASALRSPIFAATDEDLMQLARMDKDLTWRERLTTLVRAGKARASLVRAEQLLTRWGELVDRIPVHDLLDRMYCEGNILARYHSTAPASLKSRVVANLNRFLALALDADHGRYPSLMRFLARLEILAGRDESSPTEPGWQDQPPVRVLTIHGAKGLEAPVVFLADAARAASYRDRGPRSLIRWPVEYPRPLYFYLVGNKSLRDKFTRLVLDEQQAETQREEANLLYVALTRAKQMLYISGCEPVRGSRGWYGFIEKRLKQAERTGRAAETGLEIYTITDEASGNIINTVGRLEHGQRQPAPCSPPPPQTPPVSLDQALRQPLPSRESRSILHPGQFGPAKHIHDQDDSRQDVEGDETTPTAQRRGTLIHRMLELLTASMTPAEVKERLSHELNQSLSPELFETCWEEAGRVLQHQPFREFFDPLCFLEARNETAILYRQNDVDVYGLIDRMILRDREIILIDYKTHRNATAENIAQLAQAYLEQMRWYGLGVRRLWPKKNVRLILLFTACCESIEVPPVF